MNAVLNNPEVDGLLDEARRLGEERYRETVIALADGQNVDAGTVNAALAAAGRTQEDIRRHLRTAYDRREAVNADAKAVELAAEQATATETAGRLYDEIKEEERLFSERVAPKRVALTEASSTSQRLQREIRQLRRDSVNTLNLSASTELQAEFRRHSNRAVRLASAITEAKAAAGRAPIKAADAAIEDARARLDRWEATPDSPIRDDGLKSAKQRLQQSIEAREELTKVIDRLAALEQEHADATASMATFQAEGWTDWRQMNFD